MKRVSNGASINEVFAAFDELKVVLIGDVMLDSYLSGNVVRISPESPVPVVDCKKKDNRLGGSANVALNIRAMGATPLLFSVVGKDASGELLLKLLKEQGMSVTGIIVDESRPTTVKTRITSKGQQLLRVDEEQDTYLDADLETRLTQAIIKTLKQGDVDALIFQDYDKGVITVNMINEVAAVAKELGVPVLADPKHRNFLNYRNITLFKPNLKEFSQGIGEQIDQEHLGVLQQHCSDFKHRQSIDILLITLSENGIFVSGEEDLHFPTEVRFVSDVSGAGDTVISVATLCLALGLDLKHMVRLSNLGGGQVCEKPGVVPIDKQRLLERYIELFGDF